MKFSPTENRFSEHGPQGPTRSFLWDLDPELSRQFLFESGAQAGDYPPVPTLPQWSGMNGDARIRLFVAARDLEDLPWDAIAERRALHPFSLALLLPACSDRQWRRLRLRGADLVLTPPFGNLDLDLDFANPHPGPLDHPVPSRLTGLARVQADFSIPSDVKYIAPLVGYLGRLASLHGFAAEVAGENLPLAADEALSNAIRHGNGEDPAKRVRVRLSIAHGVFKLRISDEGAGFNPEAVPDPLSPEGIRRPHGRGLFLIRKLSDRIAFEDGGRTVVFWMRRKKEPGTPGRRPGRDQASDSS